MQKLSKIERMKSRNVRYLRQKALFLDLIKQPDKKMPLAALQQESKELLIGVSNFNVS
jgi:hypothetical protein